MTIFQRNYFGKTIFSEYFDKEIWFFVQWTASATDAAIHEKMFGSGMNALIIANKKMNDIMKIVKSLEQLKMK